MSNELQPTRLTADRIASTGARLVAGLLLVAGAAVVPLTGVSAATSPGVWESIPAPAAPPSGDHTATLLTDGRVLVVGGATCGSHCGYNNELGSRSAELFNPASRTWAPAGTTAFPRENHTATRLRDGRVLIAGGANTDPGEITATAEIFSPSTGRWDTVAPMHIPRMGHTATLLPDGRVLVAGGLSGGAQWLTSSELFDPVSGHWSNAAPMSQRRGEHTATLLGDGTVLVAGGRNSVGGHRPPDDAPALRTAELYNPATNAWSSVPHFMLSPRVNHTATLLADGTVMLAGGAIRFYHGGTSDPTNSIEFYHPASRTLTAAPQLPVARLNHSASRLDDGRVLIVGGIVEGDNVRDGLVHHGLAPPELFDPSTGIWTPAPPMLGDPSTHAQRRLIEARLAGNHTSTTLLNGTVLVVGGDDPAHSVELFDPAASPSAPTSSSSTRPIVWAAGAAGAVVVVGGAAVLLARRRRSARTWQR